MSFKIKNSQLGNETLGVLNNLITLNINATAAFKLSRIIKFISSIVEDKLKVEKKIYDKWIQRDEEGNPVIPKDENNKKMENIVSITNVDEFTKEMTELMEIENEIPYDKLNFDDLCLKDDLTVKDVIKIEFLFN